VYNGLFLETGKAIKFYVYSAQHNNSVLYPNVNRNKRRIFWGCSKGSGLNIWKIQEKCEIPSEIKPF
jgi:hypothetical protein